MRVLNRVELHGAERLAAARARQAEGRGLLTFSNHVALFDDPWLLACFAEPEWSRLRWISVDALNFFGSPAKARVFNAGKCVPVVRGAGVDQPGMRFLAERLAAGDWVHVFPEGGRSREPDGRLQRPLKTGVALLVQQARPLLLGFYHHGMREVLPIGARLPRIGNTVSVRFAEVHDSADGLSEERLESITDWIEQSLLELQDAAL
jgi:monolysocardiolipin acyltransferase